MADDLSLRAPLRELILLPSFRRYDRQQGAAHALATRDALLSELSASFQPDLLRRVQTVLEGYLELSGDRTDVPQSVSQPPPIPSPPASIPSVLPERSSGSAASAPSSPDPLVQNVGADLPDIAGVSPQMMARLRRIHALVNQGYRIEKRMNTFPVLRSTRGVLIGPSLSGQGSLAGYSWIGFFFPCAICLQIREWSYFRLSLISSLVMGVPAGFAININEALTYTLALLGLLVTLAICVYYGASIPYLRYSKVNSTTKKPVFAIALILGLGLTWICSSAGGFIGEFIGGFFFGVAKGILGQ